jgi:hypothetical protein
VGSGSRHARVLALTKVGWNFAVDSGESSRGEAEDRLAVARLLGREPDGQFEVVVRAAGGAPMVIRNSAFMDDGRPMPTRYWLVDRKLREAVSRLESTGGVRQAEAEIDPEVLARAHARYAAERDSAVDPGYEGPRPAGGVGGTRRGVKCLHAHLAWYLAGGDDPVGLWTARQLGLVEGHPEGPG